MTIMKCEPELNNLRKINKIKTRLVIHVILKAKDIHTSSSEDLSVNVYQLSRKTR